MKWILLHCDHDTDEVTLTEFDREDSDAAIAALNAAERGKRPQDEVVLFFSKGEESLRRTHSRYFYDARGIAEQLRKALAAIR